MINSKLFQLRISYDFAISIIKYSVIKYQVLTDILFNENGISTSKLHVGKTHLFLTISGHNLANRKVSGNASGSSSPTRKRHIFAAIWSYYRKRLIQATLRTTSFSE